MHIYGQDIALATVMHFAHGNFRVTAQVFLRGDTDHPLERTSKVFRDTALK